MVYAADVLRAEGMTKGYAEGYAKGYAEGRTEALLKMLKGRFGPVPCTIEERIYAADISELDRMIGKAVAVPTPDALFNGYGGD